MPHCEVCIANLTICFFIFIFIWLGRRTLKVFLYKKNNKNKKFSSLKINEKRFIFLIFFWILKKKTSHVGDLSKPHINWDRWLPDRCSLITCVRRQHSQNRKQKIIITFFIYENCSFCSREKKKKNLRWNLNNKKILQLGLLASVQDKKKKIMECSASSCFM